MQADKVTEFVVVKTDVNVRGVDRTQCADEKSTDIGH